MTSSTTSRTGWIHAIEDGWDGGSALRCPDCEAGADPLQVSDGAPAFGDQALLRDVKVEEVEGTVDGFDLPDFCEPRSDVARTRDQDPRPVGSRRVDDGVDVLDPRRRLDDDLASLVRVIGTGIEGRAAPVLRVTEEQSKHAVSRSVGQTTHPSQILRTRILSCSPWKKMMNAVFQTDSSG